MKLKLIARVPRIFNDRRLVHDLDTILDRCTGHQRHEVFEELMNYAKDHFQPIEEGSSRAAYKINEDLCLKVAMNSKGLAQNQVESHLAQKFHELPITQVHYVDPGGYFLIVDFAHELNIEHFKEQFNIDWYDFTHTCRVLSHVKFYNYTSAQRRELWNSLSQEAKRLFYSLMKHRIWLCDVQGEDQWGEVDDEEVLVDYGCDRKTWKEHYQ